MLEPGHPLAVRVKGAYPTLTPAQRRIVRLLIEAPQEAAFMSAAELGRRVDVSDSTVVRLPEALGYSGFPELRRQLQTALAAAAAPADLLRQRLEEEPGPANSLALEVQNLMALRHSLTPELVAEAVGLILGAQQIFVIGHRSWFGVAHLCSHLLQQLLGNVRLLNLLGGSLPDQLVELTRGDILIAFSTPRYSRQVLSIAKHATDSGCALISVTDSVLAPIGSIATVTIPIAVTSASFFPSTVAGQAIVNVLASEVARSRAEFATQRLNALDKVADEFHLFMTDRQDMTQGQASE